MDKQKDIICKIKAKISNRQCPPQSFIETYGCAQNHSDTEKLMGMLSDMGYIMCAKKEDADLIIFNTCAVRENAELKVFGNIGATKHIKAKKPAMLIGVCGCMMQQEHIAQTIKKKYKHVDFVFGTHALYRFPEILDKASRERVFDAKDEKGQIIENISYLRTPPPIAKVPIMYGCDNFCSYCIVPYVRGRERSRKPEDILTEIKELAAENYKEVMLLGQNVNSYGKGLDENIDFAGLLREVCKIDGIERIRFITSHPKDISDELIDVIASESKVCKQIHLPVQAGSDAVLSSMNRKYTKERYLEIIDKIKDRIPNATLSTDIIVGFPTETNEDFLETLDIIKKVEFDMIYSFIFSKRHGTPAEKMEDCLTNDEKHKNFDRLIEMQNHISFRKSQEYIGKIEKVLVEGESKNNKETMTGRTDGGKIVNFIGNNNMTGKILDIKITEAQTWSLHGVVNDK